MKVIIKLTTAVALACLVAGMPIKTPWISLAGAEKETLSEPQNNDRDTMYGIGSVSKVYTAAAVMKLVDEEKIDLDAPVTEYIPEFTMADERYRDITVRMLLNHSSGIMGSTFPNSILLGDSDTSVHDILLDTLKNQRLKADPGEFSVYCNDGFTLAEIVVERVSGVGFTEFIEENFSKPLQLNNTKTPLSSFDSDRLAKNYYLNMMELPKENTNVIGSGGIYATAEDLCKFAEIFMADNQGILSESSIKAMAEEETQNKIIPVEGDTVFNYGLGWDSVDTYPFNQYGIQALSKGGATQFYNSNLTVLPEYNLAAAVITSGGAAWEQIIAQEILLEVLKEEGLIDEIMENQSYTNTASDRIPDDVKQFVGIYESMSSMLKIEFSDDRMYMSSLGTKNDKTQEYTYNKEGYFISTKGDYMGGLSGLAVTEKGTTGTTKIYFEKGENGESYLLSSTYESLSSLGQTAYTLPMAQKIQDNPLPDDINSAWKARTEKTYYLISDKHTSAGYLSAPIARVALSKEISGYAIPGIYRETGFDMRNTKIVDKYNAISFQQIPVMAGRDLNDLSFYERDGYEYLNSRGFTFVSEEFLQDISGIENTLIMDEMGSAKWFRVDSDGEGRKLTIESPQNGSYYVYDDNHTCIATSLSVNARNTVILPAGGYVVFVAEAGEQFKVHMD